MGEIHGSLKINKDSIIGVLCGGMSSEREVSLRSGKNSFEALKRLGYNNACLIDVDKNIAKTLIDKKIELAFISLHGKYGEDGCIQGVLEILDIPYTGCGVKASAICMDKEFTKRIVKTQDIPLIPSLVVRNYEELHNHCSDLKYPLMVKPVSEGSSIGMSKVDTVEELEKAVKLAEKYNTGVMLEEFVEGKSVTIGVLDMASGAIATPVLELRSKTGWYDFEAKYTKGLTEFILPAEIDETTTKYVQSLAVKAHKAVEARGMSRIDFIITDNNAYLLEINTIPGMTDLSDLPAQAKAMGIEYDQLVEIILNSAFL
ncbi:MAG TPA: D-alanine--D-alanine ligase [Candidatus Gastranaerophilales bacterium]|nr:D-alanine--D-alanine ligase [Candidatus Gastranaerophilales bacterium]